MQNSAMRCLVILFLTVSCQMSAGTPKDTIIIHVDTACTDFMPRRGAYFVRDETSDKLTRMPDSIRVGNQVVDAYNKHYYLIAYDMYGTKRLEGNFWDQHAEGKFADFDYRGRKISEGNYELVKKKGIVYPSRKSGTWFYYDIAGNVMKKEEYRMKNLLPDFQQLFIREQESGYNAIPAIT